MVPVDRARPEGLCDVMSAKVGHLFYVWIGGVRL